MFLASHHFSKPGISMATMGVLFTKALDAVTPLKNRSMVVLRLMPLPINQRPKLSATPTEVRTPGPTLGQDNESIYGELLGLGPHSDHDLHRPRARHAASLRGVELGELRRDWRACLRDTQSMAFDRAAEHGASDATRVTASSRCVEPDPIRHGTCSYHSEATPS